MPRRPGPKNPTEPHALTAASVAALPITGRPYTVRDTSLGGFAVDVGGRGTKTFTLDYRVKGDRKARRVTLGRFPDVTPDHAREAARQVKAKATAPDAPVDVQAVNKANAEKRAAAAAVAREARTRTVNALADRFMTHAALRLKPSTLALYRWLLDRHIRPAVGARVAAEVTTAHLTDFHATLAETPTTANQCIRLLSTIFRFAERAGERPKGSNPATDVVRFTESLTERYLQPHELSALLRALDTAERDGLPAAPWRQRPVTAKTMKHAPPPKPEKRNVARGTVLPANPIAVAALRLLVLTGARKAEVLSLRWADVDLSRHVLTLSDTKTGRSVRPISAAAAAVLASVPRIIGSPFVFPGASGTAPVRDVSRLWDAVRHAAGLDVRLHDLRHTAASLMLQRGATLAEVGRAIGHASPRTTQRYAAIADAGAQRAADLLGDAVSAAASAPVASVTPLSARRTGQATRTRARG
jgi:integrase